MYASHRPSGENIGSHSMKGLLRNTVGLPGFQPGASSPSIGRIIRSCRVCGIVLRERQELAARVPRPANLTVLAVGQTLRHRRSRRRAANRDWTSLASPARAEHDAAAIRRPHRLLHRPGSNVSRDRCRAPIHRPIHRVACRRDDVDGEPAAVGREVRDCSNRRRGPQRRRLPVAIHPLDRDVA